MIKYFLLLYTAKVTGPFLLSYSTQRRTGSAGERVDVLVNEIPTEHLIVLGDLFLARTFLPPRRLIEN